MVINKVRVLGSGPHTPTQFFWEYPLGVKDRNSAKPNGKRARVEVTLLKTFTFTKLSVHETELSLTERPDRGNYKESAACPITKASNSSHFDIPLIFCPLLSQSSSIKRFFHNLEI